MPTAFTKDTFVIYDKEFQSGQWEALEQNVNGFNQASNGTIVLASDTLQGNYVKTAFFDALDETAISRRDPSSLAPANPKDLTQSELISVNLFRKIGPIEKSLDAWYQIAKTPEMLSFLVGQMTGGLKAKQSLNTAIKAVRAAIEGQTALVTDITNGSTKSLTLSAMVKGMAAFGDAFDRIKCWVMHSTQYFDLVGAQVTDKMDSVAGVIVYGGSPATLGKPVVVTDSPALIDLNGSADDEYWVLGLVQNAVTVKESAQAGILADVVLGKENITGRIQGEFALNLGVRGMAWDVTTGGANPTDASLATTTNWDKVVTSDKELPGVAIKCLAAG